MDPDAQTDAHQAAEWIKAQQEALQNQIEAKAEELMKRDTWGSFDAADIAEASLEVPIDSAQASSNQDDQRGRFRQFVSIATNFSSLPLAEKLRLIPDLVASLKELFENMMKEIEEYADITNELRDLIYCFTRMVMQAKHQAKMIVPLLEATTKQLAALEDVMRTEPHQQLDESDRADIKLALNRMFTGIEKLYEFAKASTAESKNLDERIRNLTTTVSRKKTIIEERLEIAHTCYKFGIPAGSIFAGALAGGCVAAEAFGGAGALAIAGTAFPPVGAVIGAVVLGGAGATAAIVLVKKFWARHQLKALRYLEEIFKQLLDLSSANFHFMQCMANAEERTQAASQNLQDIQLCLESERQRRMNRDICQKSIESTKSVIDSLNKISNIDINQWVESKNSVHHAIAGMRLLSITKS